MPAGALPTWCVQRLQHSEVLSAQLLQAGQFLAEVQVEVAPLNGQGLLVERLQVWGVLGQHATHPAQRPLLGVGQVADDLDDGPLPSPGPPPQLGLVDPTDERAQHHRVAHKVLTSSTRRSSIAGLLAPLARTNRQPARATSQQQPTPPAAHTRHHSAMTTAKRPGLRAVMAKPAYRHLFAAQTISRWGDTFNTVALVVLVFRLTGSGLGVTGAVIAEIAPVLLLAPLAGAVIDRLPQVRVLIAADLWRMALACLLPLVDQHLVLVYAVAFGLAAGGVFFNPAAKSVLPSIVDDNELVAANSGLWSAAVISQIALAPLAGALVAAVGAALSAGATSALLVVLAGRQLHVGPDGFGLLLAAIGVGAAFGPLLLARLVT